MRFAFNNVAIDELSGEPPWAVIWINTATGVVRVHFLAPINQVLRERVRATVDSAVTGPMRVEVTEREPLCTAHPDCWEAGEEMRRACYASSR